LAAGVHRVLGMPPDDISRSPAPRARVGGRLVVTTFHPRRVLERCVWNSLGKRESFSLHARDECVKVRLGPKGDVDDVVMVGLKEAAAMIRDHVQVVTDRPPEDRRREEQGDQLVQFVSGKLHNVASAQGQSEPTENLQFDDIIDLRRIDCSRPAAKVPPDIAGLPSPDQIQKGGNEMGAALGFGRDLPKPIQFPIRTETKNGGLRISFVKKQSGTLRPAEEVRLMK
jgi:hypothetical protein